MTQKNELETPHPAPSRFDRMATIVIAGTFALLVALAANNLRGRSPQEPGDEARHAQALSDVKMLGQAVEKFAADTGQFPRRWAQITPRYVQKVPLDPYGREYKIIPGGQQMWVAYYGKDGKSKGYTPMDVDVMHSVQMPSPRSESKPSAPR
jgi:hypothetical protein